MTPTPFHSLPLMGIGNLDAEPISGPNRVSLPLMGIGNMSIVQTAYPNTHLITPHGDWKLRDDANGLVPWQVLITPHGDWKPP